VSSEVAVLGYRWFVLGGIVAVAVLALLLVMSVPGILY